MKKKDLRSLSVWALLDLYEDFVKMRHYEAVDEFDRLRELGVDYEDVRRELCRRLDDKQDD